MNNSELGSKTQCLGWDFVTFPVTLPRDVFGGPACLGTLCGDCLEISSLHLLLQSISTWLKEITLPIHNNTSGSCSGNRSSRSWNNVIESLVIQEMALFPNIFHAPGKKDCLSLCLCHIPAFLLFESPFFLVAVLLLHAEPAFCAAPARSSLKDCFHKVDTRKWSRTRKIYQ